ncbi:hypothetical protein ABFV83_01060 [Lacrimispora sp. BS-2]|uniref:Uncharacterized protein n=1 Tax=Lacrimispora sp. BS-2 TaxID=3151850 RepID=A0AAU7PS79_9FIRM
MLEDAVTRGDICWHGLAFTTHRELMDCDLVNFNLSYGIQYLHIGVNASSMNPMVPGRLQIPVYLKRT